LIEKYNKIGVTSVLLSQWAASSKSVQAGLDLPKGDQGYKYDVTFVGQKNYYRGKWVEMLAERGIIVEAYGAGWERGRLSKEDMRDVFMKSRINLNFTVPQSGFGIASFGRLFLKRSVDHFVWNGWQFFNNIRQWFQQRIPQIKARPFEVSGMGGFIITGAVPGMEKYLIENKEAVFYYSVDDLAEKIRYYLAHPEEREAIRDRGYARTLSEHTWEHRFAKLFKEMHLS
jgi:spore maturation protein CgeB